MRKQHYSWWGYVRSIVREYKTCSDRETLSGVALKNSTAVFDAIIDTERMEGGENRLKVIRLLHWDKTHTLDGAASMIPCARSTVGKWQREFFEEVARNRGLLD